MRNIESAVLDPGERVNLLIGENGSGKTSLLEAIYILGRARSFRARVAAQVIRERAESLVVSARVASQSRAPVQIGVRLSGRHREISVSGQRVLSSAELVAALPILLIQPSSTALMVEAPKARRQIMDWGAFHVEHRFLDHLRGYSRALSQRNAALRSGKIDTNLAIWDQEMAIHGEAVADARHIYFEMLQPYFAAATAALLGDENFVLKLNKGWPTGQTLLTALAAEAQADQRLGYTGSGAHKADFSILLKGRPARLTLSRGQMKLLIMALLLAQVRLVDEQGEAGCTVLIDDLASELDNKNLKRVMHFIMNQPSQFFATFVEHPECAANVIAGSAMFHVEHGKVIHSN
ncbi:DNA replication/repair protein RecF [Candidatus Methylospira mobilis]|uniref:DNA replication/repair protein RecF n=1 Tax=Candidatus Methylospira mobilis TaxID=1808979 RepID=UPI0028E32296|nr:DNA replication/repair protein RecF [Candidatus Methylospira mobilis]WNV05751.1 DNA replication/repair protein RecF [Candidatus Methylospira mobilis]